MHTLHLIKPYFCPVILKPRMRLLRFMLFPFSVLYGWGMALRNFLYDWGVLTSYSFDVPVISVGNLTVGGTGKTPHVEYLLRLLKNRQRATLSRGYGRQTKGFLLADAQATAATIGDEPYQYYADFPDVAVAVSENRVEGIRRLLRARPGTEIILLDDAFQHRPVSPCLNILITDYHRLFTKDYVLPAGLLREHRSGAERADAVVVSKCDPDVTSTQMARIEQDVRKYTREGVPVFFSTYRYGEPVAFGATAACRARVVLLTGIAHATPLKQYLLSTGYEVEHHLAFRDHHAYTLHDVRELIKLLERYRGQPVSVLTTRKDAVKLQDAVLQPYVKDLPLFYLPVRVQLVRGQAQFEDLILTGVSAPSMK